MTKLSATISSFRSYLERNKIIFYIVFGIIVSFGIVYNIFHANIEENPKKKATQTKHEISHNQSPQTVINTENSIISLNQSDGITAKTVIKADIVNIAPQNRRINQEQLKILLPTLKLFSTKIKVTYATSNKEQKQFAEDIINALKVAGCNFESSFSPIMITPYGDGLHFAVNSKKPYPVGSFELQRALKDAHINSLWYEVPELPHNTLLIVIGEQP